MVACYAMDRLDTLASITDKWIPRIRSLGVDAPLIVAGCKNDLPFNADALNQVRDAMHVPCARHCCVAHVSCLSAVSMMKKACKSAGA